MLVFLAMHSPLTLDGWHLLRQASELISDLYFFRSPVLALLLVALWLIVVAWQAADPERTATLRQALDRRMEMVLTHERWVVRALALVSAAASLGICVTILGASPHSLDEFAYLFGARVFAAGQLWAPPAPEGLDGAFRGAFLLVAGQKLFSKYSPGWFAVLALGTRLGHAELVNPLLNGLTVLLFHGLICRWTNRRRALVATALLALSPTFIILGATFLTHSLAVLLHVLLLRECTLLAEGKRSAARWTLAGWLAAWIGLIRPIESVLLAVVPISWALWTSVPQGEGSRCRETARRLAALAFGPVVCIGLLLVYNHALVGEYRLTLYNLWYPLDVFGFGPRVGLGFPTGHNVLKAGAHLLLNLMVQNEDLFGWPMTSLLLPGLAVVLPAVWSTPVRLSLATCAVLTLGYAGYHYHGIDMLSRYYSSLLPLQVFLAVEGIVALGARLGSSAVPATAAAVGLGTVLALATWWPIRLANLVDATNMQSFPARRVPPAVGRTLYVVPADDFESFALFNPLDVRQGQVLFVKNGPWVADGRLARAFPGWTRITIPPRGHDHDH